MLVDFQQALADLVGSPDFAQQVRRNPEILAERYDLTEIEFGRLSQMAAHGGMKANMVLYRANRLAPVVLNLPQLCDVLGPHLRPMLEAYWRSTPHNDVHFLVEADRFRAFVTEALHAGQLPSRLAAPVANALGTEGLSLSARLAASKGHP